MSDEVRATVRIEWPDGQHVDLSCDTKTAFQWTDGHDHVSIERGLVTLPSHTTVARVDTAPVVVQVPRDLISDVGATAYNNATEYQRLWHVEQRETEMLRDKLSEYRDLTWWVKDHLYDVPECGDGIPANEWWAGYAAGLLDVLEQLNDPLDDAWKRERAQEAAAVNVLERLTTWLQEQQRSGSLMAKVEISRVLQQIESLEQEETS